MLTSPAMTLLSAPLVVAVVAALVAVVGVNGGDGCQEKHPEWRSYSGYQLLQVRPGEMGADVVRSILTDVDFWSSPWDNSTETNFLVKPRQLKYIKTYLKSQHVHYKVLVQDVGKEISREQDEQCAAVVPNKKSVVKRSTIWDDLWSTLETTLTGQRRPRKIPDHDLAQQAVASNDIHLISPKLVVESVEMTWTKYHRLGTIYAWMHQLSSQYDIMKLVRIGVTEEGRAILLAHIGVPQAVAKPAIFLEGGIHAREWISPASLTWVISELVTNPRYRDLINYYDFYVLPVANPDGYEYSHTHDRLWRKNRAVSPRLLNLLGVCKGVDLNRNFGYKWGDASLLSVKEGTALPCLETYYGEKAFSEKETRAIRDFVLPRSKHIVSYVSFHSFGSKVLYPFSYTHKKVLDWEELHHMANSIAEAVYHSSGGEDYYKIGTAADIQYEATGGADDWARGGAGIKWVYLIELPGKGRGFLLPPRHIRHVARTSMAAIQGLAVAIADTL